MKKNIIIVGVVGLLLSSCVSQKRYSDLESLQQNTKELLDRQLLNLVQQKLNFLLHLKDYLLYLNKISF
jgi:hypothetical protein